MKLRSFNLNDFEEVVSMYYEFNKEVFGSMRDISPKYFYYKAVIEWINTNKHIIVVERDNELIGFSMCFIDTFGSLTSSVYNCEVSYVKPKYRNSKATYLLFHNGSKVAKELNLNLYTNGRIENGTSDMMKKHFNLDDKFINFERKA